MDKSEKYDRQIRLWGTHGQKLIENSSIVCLNATASTTEALKNLILPGIGKFTIVDCNNVINEDLGNNFFVTLDSIGKNKAKVCCELLQELNPDVQGNSLIENPCTIIDENISWFEQFSFVLVTNLPSCSLLKLSEYLYPKNIPLLVISSIGFIGSIRLQIKEHTIIEAKPDNSLPDLRITKPWKELQDYCENIDLNELTNEYHGHIPYIVIQYQALQEWKKTHDNSLPKTFKDKEEFKTFMMKDRRTEGEMNYAEAYTEAKNAWLLPDIPYNINELFASSKCTEQNVSDFWICILALKQFVEEEGVLPLSGVLPDISSDTISYQTIQTLYKNKAEVDICKMIQLVSDVCKLSNRSKINDDYIRLICKNAHFLEYIGTRSIKQELELTTDNGNSIVDSIQCDMHGTPKWYLGLRVYNNFQIDYNRPPGSSNTYDDDFKALQKYYNSLCSDLGISNGLLSDDALQEICRFGGCEIHSVSSTLGGIAAQEIIKVITSQLVPINNTLIIDSMNCTTAVIKA